jgi:hypothetical protein
MSTLDQQETVDGLNGLRSRYPDGPIMDELVDKDRT